MDILPLYRSRKLVRAAKIVDIEFQEKGAVLSLYAGAGEPVRMWVTDQFAVRHKLQMAKGRYFVRYSDGYESISPGPAFCNGYYEVPRHPMRSVDPAVDREQLHALTARMVASNRDRVDVAREAVYQSLIDAAQTIERVLPPDAPMSQIVDLLHQAATKADRYLSEDEPRSRFAHMRLDQHQMPYDGLSNQGEA